MRSISKLFFVIVIFSTFFFTACGGEEVTLPDDESVADETTDETLDEIVDEIENETVDETDTEIEEENDSDVDEIIYTELTNWEECEDSPCSQLCHLMWDEETKERVYWFDIVNDGKSIKGTDSYLDIWLETSHNLCYVNFIDYTGNLGERQAIAEKIPISGETKTGGNPYYGSIIYFFLFDTNETWQGKKKYSLKSYTKCINDDEINWCEEKGWGFVYVDGLDGPCYLWSDIDFVPLPK